MPRVIPFPAPPKGLHPDAALTPPPRPRPKTRCTTGKLTANERRDLREEMLAQRFSLGRVSAACHVCIYCPDSGACDHFVGDPPCDRSKIVDELFGPEVKPKPQGRSVAELPRDLDALSTDAIREVQFKSGPWDSEAEKRLNRTWYAALDRECSARIAALPDDAPVDAGEACSYLDLTNTTLYNWIYRGKLTGTKKMRGPRKFTWTVPAGEIRRIRAATSAKKGA